MYTIVFRSAKSKRDFKKLLEKISPKIKQKMRVILEDDPHPSRSFGMKLNRVEKKGKLLCYELTGGDRILFDILEDEKVVMIYFAGNHDGEIRFLEKFI